MKHLKNVIFYQKVNATTIRTMVHSDKEIISIIIYIYKGNCFVIIFYGNFWLEKLLSSIGLRHNTYHRGHFN